MSLSITGNQFVQNGDTKTYIVSGIGVGYTLSSIVLPNGWTTNSTGAIVAGVQSFGFNVGIGSGTIIITYVNSGVYDTVYYDVYSGATRMGEEIKQDGVIYIPPIINSLPVYCNVCDSAFTLNVFADPDDQANFNNNDKSEFYLTGTAGILSITFVLQKYISVGWQDIVTIIDNSFGNFFPFGKHPDLSGNNFTDDFNKKYTGLFLEWIKVYLVHGTGRYRIKVTQTDIFSASTNTYSKAEYCLKKWNCHNTNGTVKIETLNQGLRGTLDDSSIQIDYSTGWKGEIRLPAFFETDETTNNREYNQYGDADYNAFKPIIDEQIPKYNLQIKAVPGWIEWYLSTNVLQADKTLVTDYNQYNRHSLVRIPVKDGILKILAKKYPNPFAPIEIKFTFGQNNLRRRNS